MKTIEDVQTIGIYHDEIRIISKSQDPVNYPRNTHRLTTTDIVRVEDEISGRDRRVILQMKDGVHCNVSNDLIKCGWFIGQTYYVKKKK